MNETLAMYAFRAGDQVLVKGWPPSNVLEMIDASDRALLTLQTPSGATLKVGRLQCTLVAKAL